MKDDVKAVLDRLASKQKLSAAALVEEGEDPKSPLHRAFDWNDETAAHAHRLHQARMLIREYTVLVQVTPGDTSNVRAYVNVSHTGDVAGTYEHRSSVVSDADKRAALLDQVLSQIERTLILNADLAELDPVVEAVQGVRSRWRGKTAA